MSLKKLEDDFLKAIKTDISINNGDNLPFGLYNVASEGKVTWVCGKDSAGTITAVFSCQLEDGKVEKVPMQTFTDDRNNIVPLTLAKAIETRDILLNDGWAKIVPPKMQFKFANQKEAKPLNRKQKRYIAKKIKTMMKDNPFMDEEKKMREDAKSGVVTEPAALTEQVQVSDATQSLNTDTSQTNDNEQKTSSVATPDVLPAQ